MTTPIEKRIRWSGLLVTVGLAILFVSLLWDHPLSFMAFLIVGCPLVLVGSLLYLLSLVSKANASQIGMIALAFLISPFLAGCGAGSTEPYAVSNGGLPVFDPALATVRVFGTVAIEGKPPAPKPLTVGDQYCRKSAQKMWEDHALTTKSGALRNVIVYVKSGFEGKTYAVPSEPVVLDQLDCIYLPHVLTIMKGQKLRILNSDSTFHNVHARNDQGDLFNIAQASKGAEDVQIFNQTGLPIRIGCDFHSWMSVYAGVFDHPFHTTSRDAGTYELRLPPGKYDLVAWHEKLGERTTTIEAREGAPVEFNFKF